MITFTREEAQQVLDALQAVWKMDRTVRHENLIETLRVRLAEPEPEPVAWRFYYKNMWSYVDNISDLSRHKFEPLYTAPPQRKEWQGLTDEDRQELAAEQHGWEGLCSAVEAKLKTKNGY